MVDVSYTLQSYSKNPKEYQMIKQTDKTKNARIGLQYGLTDSIINILAYPFNSLSTSDKCCGWKYICKSDTEQNKNNLVKLTPNTPKGRSFKWSLIFSIVNDSETCIKGALRSSDGTIALMSSISPDCQETYKYKTCRSMDLEWKICQCKMIAPPIFWILLKYSIIYGIYIDELVDILMN